MKQGYSFYLYITIKSLINTPGAKTWVYADSKHSELSYSGVRLKMVLVKEAVSIFCEI